MNTFAIILIIIGIGILLSHTPIKNTKPSVTNTHGGYINGERVEFIGSKGGWSGQIVTPITNEDNLK